MPRAAVVPGGQDATQGHRESQGRDRKFNIKIFGVILNKVNMRRFSTPILLLLQYGEYKSEILEV